MFLGLSYIYHVHESQFLFVLAVNLCSIHFDEMLKFINILARNHIKYRGIQAKKITDCTSNKSPSCVLVELNKFGFPKLGYIRQIVKLQAGDSSHGTRVYRGGWIGRYLFT